MHVVDDNTVLSGDGVDCKIKPVLDVLGKTLFYRSYSPSQELCVDEAMVVELKGSPHAKKSRACSCCGFLCTFRMCSGKPIDPCSGRRKDL